MVDLSEVFDASELVIGAGESQLSNSALSDARTQLDDIRSRLGYLGRTLIVALTGGTGSGKSSVLNAIAGEPVASVSRLRPHTEEPLAWIPDDADAAVDGLLDTLRIERAVRHDVLPGIALIDLPDMDSVRISHRNLVERLIPKVDALLWVLDPQKYRDPLLHNEFLAQMTMYSPETIVVLNKVDTMTSEDVAAVTEDVARALREDGYEEAPLFAVAAAPPDGEPHGIDALIDLLADELDKKRTARGKLLADLADLVKRIGIETGVWGGAPEFTVDAEWEAARRKAAGMLTSDGDLDEAVDVLSAVVDRVADGIGEAHRDAVTRMFGPSLIRDACRQIASINLSAAGVEDRLDLLIGDPLRGQIRRRSELAAAIANAHISVRKIAAMEGTMTW